MTHDPLCPSLECGSEQYPCVMIPCGHECVCHVIEKVRADERNEVVSRILLDFINSDYRNPHYTTDFVGYVTPQPSQLGEQA